MNLPRAFRGAIEGWGELLRNRVGWRDGFDFGPSGLLAAFTWYFLLVVGTIVIQFMRGGRGTVEQVLLTTAINILPVVGIAIAIGLSIFALRAKTSFNALLVPALYAMTFMLILGIPLSFIEVPTGPLLLALLGYALYREGRAIAGFPVTLSIAFAALCVVLLVALPLSLYMVSATGPGPA